MRIPGEGGGRRPVPAAAPLPLRADEPVPTTGGRISYFVNGEIHVNVPGRPEGKPLTTGHMDFKPSWSKTGDMLVCFRRTNDDPVTVNWKSAIFIINYETGDLGRLGAVYKRFARARTQWPPLSGPVDGQEDDRG